eukprot:2075994-Pyramimonas_sp.AAC.1
MPQPPEGRGASTATLLVRAWLHTPLSQHMNSMLPEISTQHTKQKRAFLVRHLGTGQLVAVVRGR